MLETSRPARTAIPPARVAELVLGGALLMHLAIVATQFLGAGGGKNSVLTVAKYFGLTAASLMMLQLVLISRLPWLDRRLGMDRLTRWHRVIGFALVWTVLTHFTLIVTGYAVLDRAPLLRTFLALAGVPASLLGMLAATILMGIAVSSARAARKRLSYETWHALHMAAYLALGLGLTHQLLEGTTFAASPVARVYWWSVWTLVVGGLLIGRVVMPIIRNSRHQLRVAAVVPEAPNVTSVYITGRDLHRLPARAGQFFIWRFPGHNGWWQANPFSLSAAPDGRWLRLTAKAVGTTSTGLRELPVGTRVFAEGPYGAFTSLHQMTDARLLIAGGVGITPIRALLEEPGGSTVVLYRAQSHNDAVLLPELQQLARRSGARLHLLTGRSGSGNPPFAPFEPDQLIAIVPDIVHRDVYVCGPPPMTAAVLRTLRILDVPPAQIHAEQFALAGR